MTFTEDSASVEFEQFRRAYQDGNETALTHIYKKYLPLLMSRAWRHPMFPHSSQDAEAFAITALANFYYAVKGEKFSQKFSVLPQVIAYLFACVHTAVAGDVRANPSVEMPDDDSISSPEPSPDPTDLLSHIDRLLATPQDRLLTRLRFVLEMKPAEIAKLHPQDWASPRDVSKALQRIRRRLRVDSLLCQLAGVDIEDESDDRDDDDKTG